MEKAEYEEFSHVKNSELRRLRELTTKVFSKIGTEKSRQRLVYDLLNTLKANDRNRFLLLIEKNINKVIHEEGASELSKLLSRLYIEYETQESFEKIAHTIVMGIMCIEKEG